MMQQSQGTHPHHTRYYILMTTLVIAGIFFLLLMNNNSKFSLTGSTVGIFDNDSIVLGNSDELSNGQPSGTTTATKTSTKNMNEISTLLVFSKIPIVQKEATVTEIVLGFDDLSAKVNVNDDKLELSNLKAVTLKISNFKGKLDFDDEIFSLDGTAKGIEVNGISLSSRDKIKISFDELNYQYLNVDNIEIKELVLGNGDGTLTIGDKLTYGLEQEKVTLFNFNGKIGINKLNDTLVNLEGVSSNIDVNGALLNLKLS